MTPDQIRLVQTSFQSVLAIRDQAAALFYDSLFRRDPALRPLFANADMPAQDVKLMASLGFVVQNLRDPAAIAHAAAHLAAKHRGYGVRARDYEAVGAALLDTLEAGLGPAFTPAHGQAWARAYAALAAMMLAAGEDAA